MKFKITPNEKEETIKRNIQFPKELFNTINNLKEDISLNKFVIQAIKYTINNREDK